MPFEKAPRTDSPEISPREKLITQLQAQLDTIDRNIDEINKQEHQKVGSILRGYQLNRVHVEASLKKAKAAPNW